ncbi:MAG TPA: lipoyl(octanoyl) transferase LipB [Methylotenera sp.]|nr:lipoyl(octanoyl) transferase LipB [Methylotenera sp.]
MQTSLILKRLGLTDFETTWRQMQDFTAARSTETPDELWITEHPPVYTLGLNRKNVRLPSASDIPVVLTDRGGKITYHGPGQVIVYTLLDLKRNQLDIRSLVTLLENTVIAFLAKHKLKAIARTDAPGVYVDNAKIAALGLRIKNNCCYHGLSLNVNMDLTPFKEIDPCGYVDLEVTQTIDLGIEENIAQISETLIDLLKANLGK